MTDPQQLLDRVKSTILRDEEEGAPTDYLHGFYKALQEEMMEEMMEEEVEMSEKSNNQMDEDKDDDDDDDDSVKTFDKILRMNMSDSDDSDAEEPLDVDSEMDEAKRMKLIEKYNRIMKTGRVDATEDNEEEDTHNDRVTAIDEFRDGTLMLYYGGYRAVRYPPKKADKNNKTTVQTKMTTFFTRSDKNNATRKDTK